MLFLFDLNFNKISNSVLPREDKTIFMHSVFMIPNNLDNRKDTQIIHLPVSRLGMLVEKSVSRLEGFFLCEDSPKLLFYF